MRIECWRPIAAVLITAAISGHSISSGVLAQDMSSETGKVCMDEPIIGYGANEDAAWTDWVDKTWKTYGPYWHNLANSVDQDFSCTAGVCQFSARPCKSHSGGGNN